MRDSMKLTASRDLFRFRMDGYKAAAGERTNVGATFLVQGKVPTSKRPAPVTQSRGYRLCPVYPVGRIRWAGIVGAAFRPVHRNFRMHVVRLQHHVGCADISMPGYCAAMFADSGIIEC